MPNTGGYSFVPEQISWSIFGHFSLVQGHIGKLIWDQQDKSTRSVYKSQLLWQYDVIMMNILVLKKSLPAC